MTRKKYVIIPTFIAVSILTLSACGGSSESADTGTISNSDTTQSALPTPTPSANADVTETDTAESPSIQVSPQNTPDSKDIIASEQDRQELIQLIDEYFNGPLSYSKFTQLKSNLEAFNVTVAEGSTQAFYEPAKEVTYVSHVMSGDFSQLSNFGQNVTVGLFVGDSQQKESEAVKLLDEYIKNNPNVEPNQTLTLSLNSKDDGSFELVSQRVSDDS